MPATNTKLINAVEHYFTDLRNIHATGGSTPELSYYPPLRNLLNAIGAALKPKVFCISAITQQGADFPDLGLYAAKQLQKGKPREAQLPERGVIEVKPADEDAWVTVDSYQVLKKWLSSREQKVLARPLKPEEAQHFTNTARRISRILAVTG